MNPTDTPQKFGKHMMIIAWIIGLLLLTQFFGAWEEDQINPNRNPAATQANGLNTVTLEQNRQGHYLVNGNINSVPAVFMLDTGATDVVIPARLAEHYRLEALGYGTGMTANGAVELSHTRIAELTIGSITLYDVDASINPGMDKDMPILLGMSVLKQLEMLQKDDTLILKQTY